MLPAFPEPDLFSIPLKDDGYQFSAAHLIERKWPEEAHQFPVKQSIEATHSKNQPISIPSSAISPQIHSAITLNEPGPVPVLEPFLVSPIGKLSYIDIEQGFLTLQVSSPNTHTAASVISSDDKRISSNDTEISSDNTKLTATTDDAKKKKLKSKKNKSENTTY